MSEHDVDVIWGTVPRWAIYSPPEPPLYGSTLSNGGGTGDMFHVWGGSGHGNGDGLAYGDPMGWSGTGKELGASPAGESPPRAPVSTLFGNLAASNATKRYWR